MSTGRYKIILKLPLFSRLFREVVVQQQVVKDRSVVFTMFSYLISCRYGTGTVPIMDTNFPVPYVYTTCRIECWKYKLFNITKQISTVTVAYLRINLNHSNSPPKQSHHSLAFFLPIVIFYLLDSVHVLSRNVIDKINSLRKSLIYNWENIHRTFIDGHFERIPAWKWRGKWRSLMESSYLSMMIDDIPKPELKWLYDPGFRNVKEKVIIA